MHAIHYKKQLNILDIPYFIEFSYLDYTNLLGIYFC